MNWSRAIKAVLTVALLLVVVTFVLQAFPGLIGADQSLIVQSGSMEPAIQTGSVVFVEEVPSEQVDEQIEEGDVITFSKTRDGSTTTHRVVEKRQSGEGVSFITKGDANEAEDLKPVYRGDVVGEVIFNIPYIGYVVAFTNTIYGWFILVILPMTLLLMDGLLKLYESAVAEPEEQA